MEAKLLFVPPKVTDFFPQAVDTSLPLWKDCLLCWVPLHIHSMVKLGWDLSRPPGPVPCPSRDTQSCLPRSVQTAFECLWGGDSTPSLGSVFHYSLTAWHRSVSWCWDRTSHVALCARCLLSWHWLPLTRTGLCPLCTLSSGIYYQQNPLLSLFSRLNSPGFPSHSSQERCSSPSLILAFHCSLQQLPCSGRSRAGHGISQWWLTSAQ